jgi:hypothetical protein
VDVLAHELSNPAQTSYTFDENALRFGSSQAQSVAAKAHNNGPAKRCLALKANFSATAKTKLSEPLAEFAASLNRQHFAHQYAR